MKATLLRTTLIGAGVVFTVGLLGRQAISNPAAARGAQARRGDARISALLKERRDLLHEIEGMALARYKQGQGNLEELNRGSSAAIRADLDLPHSRAERIALR